MKSSAHMLFLLVVLIFLQPVTLPAQRPSRTVSQKTPLKVSNATTDTLRICSFNNQFVGNPKNKKNELLARVLNPFDIVVIQEMVAPPVDGTFPDGSPYTADLEAKAFLDAMKARGFTYTLSSEDTGPGPKNHLNTTATEWWICFYRPQVVSVATDLPGGFLAEDRTQNPGFDRVPYAFAFRSVHRNLDFVLIPVHLRPDETTADSNRREEELKNIATWISSHNQVEKDFIILGDMNIYNRQELQRITPAGFTSLNGDCHFTTTLQPNATKGKPYDHVMITPANTGSEIDSSFGFRIVNLVQVCKPMWNETVPYPGDPYDHNKFRVNFSDHNPVYFRMVSSRDDD